MTAVKAPAPPPADLPFYPTFYKSCELNRFLSLKLYFLIPIYKRRYACRTLPSGFQIPLLASAPAI